MSSNNRKAKIYGAIETNSYITFTGFCKKINDIEQQKVNIFINGKKIDTIFANENIPEIEDKYEVYNTNGFCFSYEIPSQYVGNKHLLEFCTEENEHLLNSPTFSADKNSLLYNEYIFTQNLSSIKDKTSIKDLYDKGSIGFLAIDDNLDDLKYINYIKELYNRLPKYKLKIFYFTKTQKERIRFLFKNIPYELIIPNDIMDICKNIEIYIFEFNNPIDRIISFDFIGLYSNHILYLNSHIKLNFAQITLKEADENFKVKQDLVYTNPNVLGFSESEILKYSNSYHELVFNTKFEELSLSKIDLEENAFEFNSFKVIELSLNYLQLKKYLINLKRKKLEIRN